MANVAIMGFGTVGGGVAEVLRRSAPAIRKRLGESVELKYILDVRDLSATPYASLAVKDISDLENDGSLALAVESIGGKGVAYDFTKRLLSKGKSVVTSNKELVAARGRELLELARANGAKYLFGASVGGGIPVLGPLAGLTGANEIEEIAGILNGTTNYILARMENDGMDFAGALKQAQEKGYAERDPAADVKGLDAGRKICILSDLAWGREVSPEDILIRGVDGIEPADSVAARENGCRIKLLGRALRLADGRQAAYVCPHLIPAESPLASVHGVFNGILVRGSAVGDVMFYGRGAGDLPTASAVVGDMLEILEGRARSYAWSGSAELIDVERELPMRWYLRGAERVPAGARELRGGAFLTGEAMTAESARALKEELGARALLPVLD